MPITKRPCFAIRCSQGCTANQRVQILAVRKRFDSHTFYWKEEECAPLAQQDLQTLECQIENLGLS
jgi:hypothetical protein